MADNITLNAGSGGATLATDEAAGSIHHQLVKIEFGADGTQTPVSTANPLPVSDAAGSLTVDNATLSVVGGGAEATAQRVTIASDSTGVLSVDDNGGSLTVDGPLTDTQLRATAVPISGTVTASGPLTDIQLRASAVPVSAAALPLPTGAATLAAQLPDGHNVTVDNAAGAAAVNIQDGGNSITVDGTVTANLGTVGGVATEATLSTLNGKVTACNTGAVAVASSALPTGASTAAKQPAIGTAGSPSADVITVQGVTSMTALKVDGSAVTQPVSGSVTVASGTVTETNSAAVKTAVESVAGTVKADGATKSATAVQVAGEDGTNAQTIKTDSDGHLQIDVLTAPSTAVTGSVTVSGTVTANAGTNLNTSALAVEAGGNLATIATEVAKIDDVQATDAGALPAKGVLIQGDDGSVARNIAVDASGNVQVDIVSGGSAGAQYTEGETDATITGTAMLWEDAADTLRAVSAAKPLPVDGSAVTQPISGTVTANAGTNLNTSALALETGGNLAGVKTDTATIAGDTTSIDGKVPAQGQALMAASVPVVLASNQSAVPVSATDLDVRNLTSTDVVTVTGGAGQTADVKVTLDSESVVIASGAITETNSGTIKTAVESVAAAVKTDGAAKGATALQVAGEDGTNAQTLKTDSDGHLQIDVLSGGGGGTQYTEGDTDASITGTAVLWEDAADTLTPVSAAKPMPVMLTDGTTPVSVLGTAGLDALAVIMIEPSSGVPIGYDPSAPMYVVAAVAGDIAHDAADSSDKPVKIGGKARTAEPAAVADNDRVNAYFDEKGYQRVKIHQGADIEVVQPTAADFNCTEASASAIKTAVELIDNAISGTEMQVDVVTSALPTGAATAALQLPNSHDVTIDNASGAAAVNIQDGGNVISVDDGASSLTVDNAALSVVGSGTEATAQRVTIATDSTGVLSVDDNGASLTVDGTVAATQSGTWNVTNVSGTVSLPTGAATETTLAAIKTSVELLDNAVGGNELQCDIVGALPTGANAIGKLAANSGVDIGDVDVTSMPVVVATASSITAKLATDKIQNGLTAVTPVFVIISGATSGDNTLVAAAGASNKIRVLSYTIVAAGAVNVRFESAAGGTALTGVMSLTTNSGVSCAFSPVGHFETVANELLNMELSAAVQVSGHLTYVVVQ